MSFSVATEKNTACLTEARDAGDKLRKGVSPIDPHHVKIPNFTAEKNMLTAWYKVVLVYIANFALHDNCEEVNICITHPFKLY